MNARIITLYILLTTAAGSPAADDETTEPVHGDAADKLVSQVLRDTEKETTAAVGNKTPKAAQESMQKQSSPTKPSSDPADTSKKNTLQTLNKIENTSISELDLNQANIHDVVSTLQDMTTVNIVLTTPRATPAVTEEKEEDPFDEPFDNEQADTKESKGKLDEQIPPVTLKVRQISLLEALKLICQLTDLRMSIMGNVVMLEDKDEPAEAIQVKSFNVLPTISDRIREIDDDLSKAGK